STEGFWVQLVQFRKLHARFRYFPSKRTRPKPAFDRLFALEPVALIQMLPLIGCIQFERLHPKRIGNRKNMFEQLLSESLMSEFRVGKHHPNPAETISVGKQSRSGHHMAANFHPKTTVRRKFQQHSPIVSSLIPSGQCG